MTDKLNGYGKIKDISGTLVTSVFYNPETKHIWDIITDDQDYFIWDGMINRKFELTELEIIHKMEVNKDMLKIYNRDNNIITEGDTVEIYKGRKVPKGTIAIVNKIYPYKDNYGRIQSYYVYLNNGMKTNIDNCRLI